MNHVKTIPQIVQRSGFTFYLRITILHFLVVDLQDVLERAGDVAVQDMQPIETASLPPDLKALNHHRSHHLDLDSGFSFLLLVFMNSSPFIYPWKRSSPLQDTSFIPFSPYQLTSLQPSPQGNPQQPVYLLICDPNHSPVQSTLYQVPTMPPPHESTLSPFSVLQSPIQSTQPYPTDLSCQSLSIPVQSPRPARMLLSPSNPPSPDSTKDSSDSLVFRASTNRVSYRPKRLRDKIGTL